MTSVDAEARVLASKLTKAQTEELLSYEDGEGFMPPRSASVARYMWQGICPRGMEGPYFLLQRASGACLYRLSQRGAAVREIILSEQGS